MPRFTLARLGARRKQTNCEMIALLALFIWLYLCFMHGKFWQSGPELVPAKPEALPAIDIIIPARDEAHTIAAVIASLVAQDYAGAFTVSLVDDNSTDGTVAAAGRAAILRIISGAPKPSGWSGKLWALSQGVAATRAPVLLFSDADVVHDPRHLSALVARLEQPAVEMVSEMVHLNCTSFAERALIPAFVYFFQMLYPFSKVNDPRAKVAAAAGGTVLIRRAALERVGGIEAMKNALIDDVALAKLVKRIGPIYLGHSGLAGSIRGYPHLADIWHMISRTAFTQLRHSALILALTLIGLALVWLVPLWAILFTHRWERLFGAAAFALAALSYMPTLKRFGQTRLFCLALPLIASFYMAATLGSALNHWFGQGVSWKNRSYGDEN